jgi:predicted GNAT family N-acyltransferase
VRDLEIKLVEDKEEFIQAMEIRRIVFIEEQDVPLELELDRLDSEAEHVIAYLDNEPIGCARIRINKYAKLERIAIIKNYRGRGFGRQLTNFLIDYCRKKKVDEIYIHSRADTSGFYQKNGFNMRGESFYEAGVEHIEMYMCIRSQ